MTETPDDEVLIFESDFDEPPDKLWRAINVPELRAAWLGEDEAAMSRVAEAREPDRLVLDWPADGRQAQVAFEVGPGETGGSRLGIVHRLRQSDTNVVMFPARRTTPEFTSTCGCGSLKWAA